jgi:hypothetical protein
MPRNISADVQAELQTSQVNVRTLLEIFLLEDSIPLASLELLQEQYVLVSQSLGSATINGLNYYVFYFVANDVQNLVIPSTNLDPVRAGLTYIPADIDRGKIDTNIDGSLEKMPVKMSNRSQVWAGIVANLGNIFLSRPCNVLEYFPDYPNEAPVLIFSGAMNEIKMNATNFEWSVKRSVMDFNEQSPNMTYDVNCQYNFEDSRCKYAGSPTVPVSNYSYDATSCDGVMSTCKNYGNIINFGGHPSVPRQMVIR